MLTREQIEAVMRDGATAFEAGLPRENCPYRQSHPAYDTWIRGYQNAAFGAAMNQRSNP